MNRHFPKVRVTTVFFALIGLLILTAAVKAQSQKYNLDNGMEVILKENHGSPMVSSIVFVKSGAKYESRFENGITHFLEHLLFNGTTSLGREELDNSVRNLGGYLNAFTRKELTTYLVLLPKQYINFGMTVQADMLFNSTIPEEELAKERKVVIEEIKRDADSPTAAAESFFTEKAYAGTLYDRPVLGYKAFIENIPRDAILQYWKKYYKPSNMTLLVIGDFQPEAMKTSVASVFGAFENPPVPEIVIPSDSTTGDEAGLSSAVDDHLKLLRATGPAENIKGQHIYDTVAAVTSTQVNFSFAAPHFEDSAYLAVDLLSQYLAMDDISPLMKALKGGAEPLATEASVYLQTYAEFSRLEISVITDNAGNADSITSIILDHVRKLHQLTADTEVLAGIKTSVKCDEIFNAERLHYLGFIIAPMMMTAGWDFIQTYAEELGKVTWPECQQAAETWFSQPDYVATVVRPAAEGQLPYVPREMTTEEVSAYFASATIEPYVADTTRITYPITDSVSFELDDRAEYYREELANGMTVIIKSRQDSRVFAMNILGKNRSAAEPSGKEGITDFVNRCIEKGTITRSSSELSRDLARIGAKVTLSDNPWIPYDDRYTTRQYSFMKFETIDEYAEKGFHLFSEMLLYPAFDSVEVENVRRSMLGVLGRNSASGRNIARDLFYGTLFEGKAYAKPIMGSMRSLNMISVEDLRSHHASFYAPENTILSIVTNKPVAEVMKWVDLRFGRLVAQTSATEPGAAPEAVTAIKTAHKDIDKEQINIYLGSTLPGAGDADAVAIGVATSLLSSRLYLNLREKQGLAYSVGASAFLDRDFGWYYCSIGTGFENYQKAVDGIILQIEKLKLDGPTQQELSKARNQLWGRSMSAKLASINQAFYLGVDEYLQRGYAYDAQYLSQLSQVSLSSVRQVISRYFDTERYVIATAGKLP